MPSRHLLAAVAVAMALAAACGDDGDDGATQRLDPAGFDLFVEAREFAFNAPEYQLTAGSRSIAYVEKDDLIHNLVIEDGAGRVVPIQGGDSEGKLVVTRRTDASGRAELVPGTYRLICTIPGHAQAGMTATLTVT